MQDCRYGRDLRQLTRQDIAPCFLHSYSTILRGCPCGCRATGFSQYRLLRDGARGFYIVSMKTGRHRWLHPREAALLCGLDPMMKLPSDLRAGLCLVGQCASPLQAAWMGAHLVDAMQGSQGTPRLVLLQQKMWLLRQAHGLVPKKIQAPLQLKDAQEGNEIEMTLQATTTVGEMLEAETRLQGGGELRQVHDLYGKLPMEYDITHGAVAGELVVYRRLKRQKKEVEPKMVTTTVVIKQSDGSSFNHVMQVMAGTFVFEVMRSVPRTPSCVLQEHH